MKNCRKSRERRRGIGRRNGYQSWEIREEFGDRDEDVDVDNGMMCKQDGGAGGEKDRQRSEDKLEERRRAGEAGRTEEKGRTRIEERQGGVNLASV